jgi:hypothetical protein
MTIKRLLKTLAILTPLVALPAAAQEASVDTISIGQRATDFFYEGEMDSLWAMLTPAFQEGLGSTEKLFERLDFLSERAGDEVAVIEETVKMRKGRPQYWRVAEFDLAPEPLLLRWVISPDGKVAGQGMGPASQAPPTDDEQ